MAKQTGVIPIEGTLGNITFYRTADGYLAKQKTHISANRIATDPAFTRTRENGEEFGRACKASKFVRTAFRGIAANAGDKRVSSRLVKILMTMIRLDNVNPRGKRDIIDTETTLLEGFDFNGNATLTSTLFTPFTATVARVSGDLSVSVPPFNPAQLLKAPSGATHYRIVMGGTEINFTDKAYKTDRKASGYLPYNNQDTILLSLISSVPAASPHPLFVTVGVEFYQQVNGQYYSLKEGSRNPLTIVKCDVP